MKTKPIVRIEETFLRIIRTEDTNKDDHLNESTLFEFPYDLKENLKGQPEALAAFIAECLRNCKLSGDGVILTFDNKLGFFKEYQFNKTDRKMADKRFYVEDDNQKETKESVNITQRLDYPDITDSEKLNRAAIYGIDDKFFRTLIKSLKKNSVKVIFATSSLIMLKDTMVRIAGSIPPDAFVKQFAGISIEEDFFRAVITEEEFLSHLEEKYVADDTSTDKNTMVDLLTDFLKKNIKSKDEALVVIEGENTETTAKRLSFYSGIKCITTEKFMEEYDPGKTLFTKQIKTGKLKEENYLYGGLSKLKFSKATAKICGAATIVLALLFSMLPLYSVNMTRINNDLNTEIGKYELSEMLRLVYEKRDVYADLQLYKDDMEAIKTSDINYSEVLTIISEELIPDATINDLLYEEKSGLIVDFDIEDVKEYKNTMDRLNDERKILVTETARYESEDGGKYNIQIKITIPKGGGG